MNDFVYPRATREIGEQRRELAPEIHQAFDEFSRKVFAEGALPEKTKQLIAVAAEMRAGGAFAHSTVALRALDHAHR